MDTEYLKSVGYELTEIILFDKIKAIYKCHHSEPDRDIIIKRYRWNGNDMHLKYILREREIWQTLKHENIVELFKVFESPMQNNIVDYYDEIEMCSSDIQEWLKRNKIRSLNSCHQFIKQIIAGVVYLHSEKVMHRNIKPQNILITDSGVCKLSGFAIAVRLSESKTSARTRGIGTLYYSAPEQIGLKYKGGYDYKVDIYSLGLILMEFFTIFDNITETFNTVAELRQNGKLNDKFFDKFDKIKNEEFYKRLVVLIERMVNADPSVRPDITEVSEFFAEYNFDEN